MPLKSIISVLPAGFFSFDMIISKKESSEFQPALQPLKLTLCHILIVMEGLG